LAEQRPVAEPGGEAAALRPGSRTTWSTSRPATFAALLLGGLLGVVSSAQPWWRAAGGGSQVSFTGTESTGGLSQALAVVALAGTLLVLVLRVKGRRVVAVLLAAVGVGLVLVGALRLRPSGDSVRTKMREVSLIDQYAVSPSAWPWIFAVGGLLVLAGAAGLAVGAPRWSTGAARFVRPGQDSAPPANDDPAAIWKALDAGLDPTAAADADAAPGPEPPDVQIDGTRDTMGNDTDEQPSGRHQPDRDGRGRSAR
jgi:uncharacterized membrane protein (TIGR02234 family)